MGRHVSTMVRSMLASAGFDRGRTRSRSSAGTRKQVGRWGAVVGTIARRRKQRSGSGGRDRDRPMGPRRSGGVRRRTGDGQPRVGLGVGVAVAGPGPEDGRRFESGPPPVSGGRVGGRVGGRTRGARPWIGSIRTSVRSDPIVTKRAPTSAPSERSVGRRDWERDAVGMPGRRSDRQWAGSAPRRAIVTQRREKRVAGLTKKRGGLEPTYAMM